MESNKCCKNCGSSDLVKNRKICVSCNNLRMKEYYSKRGKSIRIRPNSTCQICSEVYTKWRKSQVICPICYKQSLKTKYKNNCYKKIGCRDEHRVIAENLLGRKLTYNEVVHHIDENPLNNDLKNLLIMSRHHHGRLHGFLRIQRVAYEKSLGMNSVNCWNTFRVAQTTAWLETTNANVIKLCELGNQQPSILTSNVEDEGSETRHGTPDQLC